MDWATAMAAFVIGVAIGVTVDAITGLGRRVWHSWFPPDPTRVEIVHTRPPVTWELTRLSGYNFQLRNTGVETARSVTINPAQIMQGVLHRDLPTGIDILGGASHRFLIQGTWGKSLPGELWVKWEGGPSAGEPLPMPR